MKTEKVVNFVGAEVAARLHVQELGLKLNQIPKELFALPDGEKEYFISACVQRVLELQKTKDPKAQKKIGKFLNSLIPCFQSQKTSLSQQCQALLQQLLQIVPPTESKRPTVATDFSTMTLSDLFQNLPNPSTIRGAIVAREQLDPPPTTPSGVKPKFVRSIIERPEQSFLLACMPIDQADGADYVEQCFNSGVLVMVSAHEFIDATEKQACPHFWSQDVASQVRSWHVQAACPQVFQEGTRANLRGEMPKIMETALVGTSPAGEHKVLTHLHYTAWPNRSGNPPDEPLMHALLDRIQQLSVNPQTPVAINCKSGVGRTGVIAFYLSLRRIIDEAIRTGTTYSRLINIPEMLYQFRLKRPGLLGKDLNEGHFSEALALAKEYYDRRKL